VATTWKFGRRQGLCSGCGVPFPEGQTLFSVLRFEGDDLQRGDLCEGCFDAREPEGDLFWWRTSHAPGRVRLKVDFDLLLSLVRSLVGDSRPERLDLAFLLALLLIRHRRLRLTGISRVAGREILNLRRPRTREVFPVEVRELDSERRGRLTEILGGLMDPTREGGWEGLLEEAEAPGAVGGSDGSGEGASETSILS